LTQAALVAAAFTAVFVTTSCTTAPEPAHPADSTKYTLENTDRFVVLDRLGRSSVTCTGFTEHALADGRLEVVANLKNREDHPVDLQASCVFKDEQGLNVVEESPWQKVSIPKNATEAVRFTAVNLPAKTYTVRVREVKG
jgi:hypothetical protein